MGIKKQLVHLSSLYEPLNFLEECYRLLEDYLFLMSKSMGICGISPEPLELDTAKGDEPYCASYRYIRRLWEEICFIEYWFLLPKTFIWENQLLSMAIQENEWDELPVYVEKWLKNASDVDRKSFLQLLESLDQASRLGNDSILKNILMKVGVRTLGVLLKTEKVDEIVALILSLLHAQSLTNERELAFLSMHVGSVPHRMKKTVLETSQCLWIFFYYYFRYFYDAVRSFLQMSVKIETGDICMSLCTHSAYEQSKFPTVITKLFKRLYVCVLKADIDTVFEQLEKPCQFENFETHNFETVFGANKTRRVVSIDSCTAIRDKRSEVFTVVLKGDAGSASTVPSTRSTQARKRTALAVKKTRIPEHARSRYEYAEAAVRSMQFSLQKGFHFLTISFIILAGLCGAYPIHDSSSELQGTPENIFINFRAFDGNRTFVERQDTFGDRALTYIFRVGLVDSHDILNQCFHVQDNYYLAIEFNTNVTIQRELETGVDCNWNISDTSDIGWRISAEIIDRSFSDYCSTDSYDHCDDWNSFHNYFSWGYTEPPFVSSSGDSYLDKVADPGNPDVERQFWAQLHHLCYCDSSGSLYGNITNCVCRLLKENLEVDGNYIHLINVKMVIFLTCVILLTDGCLSAAVLSKSKNVLAMLTPFKEPCCNSKNVVEKGFQEVSVENQRGKYQSAEDDIQSTKYNAVGEPNTRKIPEERDIFLSYSEPELDHDTVKRIYIESSADVQIYAKTLTNSNIPKNDSKALPDVKEKVLADQVGKLQSDVADILKRQNDQEKTERFPRYEMEVSGQFEVSAAVFSKTASPFSAEEEEEFEVLSKCLDYKKEDVFDRSNETFCKTLADCYEQTGMELEKHLKFHNTENSRFQMRQRVDFDAKLDTKGCVYDFLKQCSGLIEERTDSANAPDRVLHLPDLSMSEQPRADDKTVSKNLITKTFDRHNISQRMPPKNHFKDERFRMIAFDETTFEVDNKHRVNGLRRFSPMTSAGRVHQLDKGSPKYRLGEKSFRENYAEDDDCHVLRNITWLPLNELPVPDIYTCINVHSAAQVILNRIASGERVGAQESMKFEVLRVCTFRNYPSEDKPFRLLFSTAGMYYASDRDEVVCYSCGLRKAGWKETDIPIDVHKRIRANCEFLVNNSAVNFPIPELEGSQLEKFKTLEDLLNSNERPPTQKTEITGGSHGNFDLNTSQSPQYRFFVPPPKHPQYAVQSVRLDTFKGWPTNIPQTPQIMAECGYYYAGFGDCVRCFHCGIGLRHWTEDDYPWIEHARWSKDCAYLRQVKGEEFIQNVHLAIDQDEEPEDLIPATASGQPADMSQVTPNDDSNQILLTDPAQSVLEMGYQPRTIKKAIDIILRSEGRSGINAAKIMETIFMLEERSDNLEQEVANITISGASSETELQSQNGSEGSHNKATDENEKKCSAGQPPTSRSTGQNSSSNQTQRNTAKGQASNRNAGQAQRSSEVKTQVQKGTAVKSEDKGHAKSDPKKPPNRVTKNEDAASPKSSPHSSLEEKSKGATGTPSTSRDTFKIKAENQKLKEQTICKVCLDKPVSIVFLPCGHLVTCAECAPAMKKCPICRGIVKGMVKAFMS